MDTTSKARGLVESVSQFTEMVAGLDLQRLSSRQRLAVIRSQQVVIDHLEGARLLLQGQLGREGHPRGGARSAMRGKRHQLMRLLMLP
jgi:hypothetical protein